ncbi:MAG TPA: response regulator [Vicinamibacteria bacterium]|nr:response regulator [Vicinamibacteria bacterium]
MPTATEPRVLVVDDSIVVRRILCLTLRQIPEYMRAQIDEAGNGAIALSRLREHRYDLVLSDVRMPYLDGVGLVRRVRTELKDLKTPIFLISTLGSEEDVQRGLAAGATAYILKPLSPHVIMKALQEYLAQQAKLRRETTPTADGPER